MSVNACTNNVGLQLFIKINTPAMFRDLYCFLFRDFVTLSHFGWVISVNFFCN